MIKRPYYPIVYLRGYAGTQREVENTVSTPYMGFNLGSTRLRQAHTGDVLSHVFQSPVIRLMKDHDYKDAYRDGEILPRERICSRSIWIFRYYDISDEEFGDGERREIEFHAKKLSEFLRHVRQSVLEENEDPSSFRAYLVAHSMGGLICRCYLQNPDIPDIDGKAGDAKNASTLGVDKVFTYGTPHGGIEFRRGLKWLEGMRDFLDPNNAGNFGPRRMREFLALPNQTTPINSLNGRFPEERVFCLVGTNSRDYRVAAGMSRRAVGTLSDGLVQIKNATVLGAPRAHVYRSHSGYFGLVNSESGYQNLRRFLFGEWRVMFEMTNVTVTLPNYLESEKDRGKKIRASYHVEAIVSVRGVPVEISRRTYDDESAVFRNYEDLKTKSIKIFTAFLIKKARVDQGRKSLGLALRLQVRVPDYELDGRPWVGDHYEGGTLFSDKLNVEFTPHDDSVGKPRYGWDSSSPNSSPHNLEVDNAQTGTIPFNSGDARPGISGEIKLTIARWNTGSE